MIWPRCEAKYFCREGWTGESLICPTSHLPLNFSIGGGLRWRAYRIQDLRPVLDTDWLRMLAVSTKNRVAWRAHPSIEEWLLGSRLNTLFATPARVRPEEIEKIAVLKRLQDASSAAMAKLPQLLAHAARSGGG